MRALDMFQMARIALGELGVYSMYVTYKVRYMVGVFCVTNLITAYVRFHGATYLDFHFLWTLPILGLLLWRTTRVRAFPWRVYFLLVSLATSYCIPWDDYMISSGVWDTEDHKTIGRFWNVPYEEILFMILMPLFVWSIYVIRCGIVHVPKAGDFIITKTHVYLLSIMTLKLAELGL